MPKNCKYEDGKNYAGVMGFRPDSGKSGKSKCGDKKGCKSDLDPFKPYLSDQRDKNSQLAPIETKGSVVYADFGWNTNNNNDKQCVKPAPKVMGYYGLPNIPRSQSLNTGAKYGGMSYQMSGKCSHGVSFSAQVGTAGGSTVGSVGTLTDDSGLSEKQELTVLNARLMQYIRHMRDAKGLSNDSSYDLELEWVKIKTAYEKELARTRSEVDAISKEKRRFETEWETYKGMVEELRISLKGQTNRADGYLVELDKLKQIVAQKDLEIAEFRITNGSKGEELQRITALCKQLQAEIDELKIKLSNEQSARLTAEDKYTSKHKAVIFQQSVTVKEIQELQARLEQANNTIKALEERLRRSGQGDDTVMALIAKVKASNEQEFGRFKLEFEKMHACTIQQYKLQISEDDKRIAALKAELVRINDQIAALLVKNKEFEGQISGLVQQRDYYLKMYEEEKSHSSTHVKRTEAKLLEMQGSLMAKMQELSLTRDAQVSLKAEIASFRLLIEEEERRLNLAPVKVMSTSGNVSGLFSTSGAFSYEGGTKSQGGFEIGLTSMSQGCKECDQQKEIELKGLPQKFRKAFRN